MRDANDFGRIHINRHGFRGPDVQVRKDSGTTRIMAMGASATFDICVERDAEAWPARMDFWLDSLAPHRRFEVLNTGVPGLLMMDNIIRLQTELYAFAPDIIMLYAGHGTVGSDELARMARAPADGRALVSRTPDATPVVTPWKNWLAQHSLLYHRLSSRFGSRAPAAAVSESEWRRGLDYTLEEYRRDLVTFVLTAQGLGARVVIVELAHLSDPPPAALSASERAAWRSAFAAPPEIILEGFPMFSAVQRSVADSLGAAFIPTNAAIRGEQYYCPGNPVHLNREGAELLGRRLAEALLASETPQASRRADAPRRAGRP